MRNLKLKTRTSNSRPIKKVVLIVCEGEKTEPNYFETLKKVLRKPIVVRVIHSRKKTDPIKIVEKAIEEREKNKNVPDYTWCVYDADSNSNEKLIRAKNKAERENINIAFSNPCFEIWYLLHFDYSDAPILDAKKAKEKLAQKCRSREYQENDNELCLTILPHTDEAVTNAIMLRDFHLANGSILYTNACNPCTHVDELVTLLKNL